MIYAWYLVTPSNTDLSEHRLAAVCSHEYEWGGFYLHAMVSLPMQRLWRVITASTGMGEYLFGCPLFFSSSHFKNGTLTMSSLNIGHPPGPLSRPYRLSRSVFFIQNYPIHCTSNLVVLTCLSFFFACNCPWHACRFTPCRRSNASRNPLKTA